MPFIPYQIAIDNDLQANAKLLFGFIHQFSDENSGCIKENSYFMQVLNVDSDKTIRRYLESLKIKNYIQVSFIEKPNPKNGKIRVITPTGKHIRKHQDAVLYTKNRYIKGQQQYQKGMIPNDIEADWLDDYMKDR